MALANDKVDLLIFLTESCEWMRSDDSMDDCAQAPEVGHALEPYLPVETSMAHFGLVNSLKEGTAFIAVFRLGVHRTRNSKTATIG